MSVGSYPEHAEAKGDAAEAKGTVEKRGCGYFRVKADFTIGFFSTRERCDAKAKTN
jgi:hypothetical protein